jgi:hypothetical protein
MSKEFNDFNPEIEGFSGIEEWTLEEELIDNYGEYAEIDDSEIVELTIDDKDYYGFICLGRKSRIPDEITNVDSFNFYELRENEEGDICSVANHVNVNFGGTFVTKDVLPIDEEENEELDVDINYLGI